MTAPSHPATPFATSEQRFSAGRFGMKLFLLSLAMLFAASLIAYLVVRIAPTNDIPWRPKDAPGLPGGLWISTFILAISSGTLHWAMRAIRRDHTRRFTIGIFLTTLLGLGFLLMQAACWVELIRANLHAADNLYAYTFYVLTALHAAHVIGGLIPLTVVSVKSFRGAYCSREHRGPHYTEMYWHFLGIVWVILFATLGLGSL